MPRARLIAPQRYRAELRARRTVRYLRRLAAQVQARSRDAGDAGSKHSRHAADGNLAHLRHLHTLLSNGAWAVEDLYDWHKETDDRGN